MQVDFLLSRLKVLYERIDDTEDLINIELDHRYLSLFSGFDRDWPIVHGIHNGCQQKYILPAEADALPHEGRLPLVVHRYLSCT